MRQMTSFKQTYNVGTDGKVFFVMIGDQRSNQFLSFDKYKLALDKVMKLNSNVIERTTPKFKKLFSTNARGKTNAAKPRLC